ncbi:MAG TPA: OmpA family protein [Alphaproteobacteria bacterium]|jgi:OOP family OmpA-OmpF porin
MRRGTVWLIGVLGVVVLWGAAVAMKARPIERQIALAAVTELKRRGLDRRFDALSIQIDGRDLALSGTALTEEDRVRALAVVAATPGINRVTDRTTAAMVATPFVFRAIRNADGSVTLTGVAPSPELIDRVGDLGRSLFGSALRLSLRLARGAPEGDWFAAAKLAVELAALVEQGEASLSDRRLAVRGLVHDDAALDSVTLALARAMPAGYEGASEVLTPLDAELRGSPIALAKNCQALIDRVAAGHAFAFAPGGAALVAAPARLFDRMARALRRCEGVYLHVFAAGDASAGDAAANLRLGHARATALADELARRGVPRARMTALGRGRLDPRPRAGGPDVEFLASDQAVPVVRPYFWQIVKKAEGGGAIAGHHPSREARSTLAALARPALGGAVADETHLAQGAPPGDWLAAARLAIEAVARLEAGSATLTDDELLLRGAAKDDATAHAIAAAVSERMPKGFQAKFEVTTTLDEALQGGEIAAAERCQALFDAVARTASIEFVFDGATLLGRQRRLFERLAAAARRCQGLVVEIGGHGPGAGDPEASRALSERWAQAVADAVSRAGAERRRLRAVGYGNMQPLGESASDAGRLRNRRIVFRIVP